MCDTKASVTLVSILPGLMGTRLETIVKSLEHAPRLLLQAFLLPPTVSAHSMNPLSLTLLFRISANQITKGTTMMISNGFHLFLFLYWCQGRNHPIRITRCYFSLHTNALPSNSFDNHGCPQT